MGLSPKPSFLILGANGFIGSALVSELKNQGYPVQSFFRKDDLESAFKLKPDVCINAAGLGSVLLSVQNPELDKAANLEWPRKVLNVVKKTSPSTKFVNLSSGAVYGHSIDGALSEKAALNPVSPYGEHKKSSEELLLNAFQQGNLKTVSARIFSAYGPGLKKQLFWDLAQKLKNNSELVHLHGTGSECRDFIYIEDLVNALVLISQNASFEGEAINVGSGLTTSIREAATLLADVAGWKGRLQFDLQSRSGDPAKTLADISTLKQWGFLPKTSLKKGLQNYVQWLRSLT